MGIGNGSMDPYKVKYFVGYRFRTDYLLASYILSTQTDTEIDVSLVLLYFSARPRLTKSFQVQMRVEIPLGRQIDHSWLGMFEKTHVAI